MASKHPVDSMNFLYDIMNDLYGGLTKNPAATRADLDKARAAVQADFAAPLTPAAASPAQAAPAAPAAPAEEEPAAEPVPELPPFDEFWQITDDSVDWTDALAYREPTDGLTDPKLWSFYHEQAGKVLEGNLGAYVAVLKRANPLNDLLPYAGGFHVKADDADTLSVTFETLPDYMKGDEAQTRRYLAGISLRAARDLLGLLPVCEAKIHVTTCGLPSLDVTYTRQEVQKVRFSFVDPVEFCLQCGGDFKDTQD